LLGLSQAGAEPKLGQAIHRASQSTIMKLRAMIRSGFLTKTEEARNSGYAQKAKASLRAALVFVGRHESLVGEDRSRLGR
jgi:hypothetical protein